MGRGREGVAGVVIGMHAQERVPAGLERDRCGVDDADGRPVGEPRRLQVQATTVAGLTLYELTAVSAS